MKALLRIVWLAVLAVLYGQAATRSDINTIEAAENVRYLSQKIAKDYLYLYSRPKRIELKKEIRQMLNELNKNFKAISASTRDDSTKDLLRYLEYNQEGMRELLSHKVTKEGSQEMLDYSEILLEGADSIAREHSYPFNKEEKMLMNIKRYEYLVERLGKFYMAASLGALSQANREKMETSRQALSEGLKTIEAYQYPDELTRQKQELKHFWHSSTYILSHAYDMFVPNLVNITGNYFEQLLTQFALYHSKSQ